MVSDKSPREDAGSLELSQRLSAVRPRLLAFARLQLADQSYAEDLVQETLVAALESLPGFRGQSKFETWVFGILRHKLVDTIRRRGREVVAEHDVDEPTLRQRSHDDKQA